MSETIRIRTEVGKDKFINVPINQNFDLLEILSLKITQDELYPLQCADYGVLVGRVYANGGFGVPNAKVSVFIPISSDDESDPVISALYPYKTVDDSNSDGIKYNLLPKKQQSACHQPVGTFPSKQEVLDNNTILEIFEKYYKYTTTTNFAGDYMICGVPVGQQTVHIDVDLSDMGVLSQRPYDMAAYGYNDSSFASPTKFKASNNLSSLPQIITQNSGVDVMPFWGDVNQCNVGINRLDFELPYTIEPCAFFIGNIFSDSDKHSVNKNCRPRKNMGDMCQLVSRSGKIEMIRKTIGGQNDYFTVDGGRNIDDDGTWVMRVPMNLEYKVTDEYGNLVDSEDPRKGIPTTAKVRFRIGIDNVGTDGRLRTTAKYLVPNNPEPNTNPDYTFGPETNDMNNNFAELKWNNIYTVRNFIPRLQSSKSFTTKKQTFTGIKQITDCDTYTEFPYNRIDGVSNPIFSIVCLIMKLVVIIISSINVLFSFFVAVIGWWNIILSSLCSTLWKLSNGLNNIDLPLIGRIDLWPGSPYCMGEKENDECNCDCIINYKKLLVDKALPLKIDCGEKSFAPGFVNIDYGCGPLLDDVSTSYDEYFECLESQLGDTFNVYRFDFYNDWVNGSLYSFLFKYKKRQNDKIKYCAYDCNMPEFENCEQNFLVDTCAMSYCSGNCDQKSDKITIPKGFIKKYGDYYYYASTHGAYKLFATDITLLGNINTVNIWNLPVIYPYLPTTTYQLPPLTDDDTTPIDPLLMKVECQGVYVQPWNCKNVRLVCEIGRGLDDNLDNVLDNNDIEVDYVRKSLRYMNTKGLSTSNTQDEWHNAYRNFMDTIKGGYGDGESLLYNNCTTVLDSKKTGYPQNNSYYFYFGLNKGNSALDKLLTNYLTDCDFPVENDFIVSYVATSVTTYGGNNGSLIITAEGGTSPYIATINGVDYPFLNSLGLNNLISGTYIVKVTDANGWLSNITAVIDGVELLDFYVTTNDAYRFGESSGEIIVSGVNGGVDPFKIQLTGPVNMVYGTPNEQCNQGCSYTFSNLPAGTYVVTVTDSSKIPVSTSKTNIIVKEPTKLVSLVVSYEEVKCYGGSTGKVSFKANGGTPPYTYSINNGQYTLSNITNLKAGTYVGTVTDSHGQTSTIKQIISQPNRLTMDLVSSRYNTYGVSCYGGSNGTITANVVGGTPPYLFSVNDSDFIYGNVITNLTAGDYMVGVKDSNGCELLPTKIIITQPSPLNITTSSQIEGLLTRAVTVTASGGVGGVNGFYKVDLDSSGSLKIMSGALNNQYTYTGVSLGAHTFRLYDGNGCYEDFSVTII